MREELRDPLRLDHIKDAIERLIEFDASCPLENIDDKDIRYYGAVKLLEIIGEAAYKLTNEFKMAHPDTPWKYIVGMRHVLVHGYFQISKDNVIRTIREDLPSLLKQTERYLREFDDE
ncbi:MAG: DUF86 domain-containing protein [Muribaculaceae bacterium]|nr:DUF86 domain-containing protein [Muribaculaceae bacterium]